MLFWQTYSVQATLRIKFSNKIKFSRISELIIWLAFLLFLNLKIYNIAGYDFENNTDSVKILEY